MVNSMLKGKSDAGDPLMVPTPSYGDTGRFGEGVVVPVKPSRGFLLYAFLLGMAFVCGPTMGKTCLWTGAGDGCRLGDTLNWSGAPLMGDTLVLTNRSTATLLLSNDLGSVESPFTAGDVTFTGDGAICVIGNPLGLGQSKHVYFHCPVTNEIDFVFASSGRHIFWLGNSNTTGSFVQNGDILGGDGTAEFQLRFASFVTGSELSSFNGDILLPNGSVDAMADNNSVNYIFRGRVVAKNVNYSTRGTNVAAYRGFMHFYNPSNDIRNIYLTCKKVYTYGDDGFGTNVIVRRGSYNDDFAYVYLENGTRTTLTGWGVNDQHTAVTTKGNVFTSANTAITDPTATLILRDAEVDAGQFVVNNRLNFTWAPLESDKILDVITSRAWSMSGELVVKGGTLRTSASGVTFVNVPELTVAENAMFEMVGGATSALTGLKFVTLEDGAVFRLGANEKTPFTANQTVFRLYGSAKLDLSCAITTAVSVFTNDVLVAADTYESADWLTGTGSIVVTAPTDYHWTGMVDSDWNEAGNWTVGVPRFSTQKNAYVRKRGETKLNVSTDAPTLKSLELVNNDGTTTLDVKAELCVSNGTLAVGTNVEIKVGSGGVFKYDVAGYKNDRVSPTFTLKDGGKITVDGGELKFSRVNGRFMIGDGDVSVTSALSIASGRCYIDMERRDSLVIQKGGILRMTGGVLTNRFYYTGGAQSDCFKMTGGTIDLSGTAELALSMYASSLFGNGKICLAGTSRLIDVLPSGRRGLNPNAESGLLDICVSEQGKIDLGAEDRTIVNNANLAGGRTRITVADSAQVVFGLSARIGDGARATGEIVLKDSASFSHGGYYGMTFGKGGSSTGVATGILRMSGGTLTAGANQSETYPNVYGLVFGDGASNTATGEIWNRGLCYLSGGKVNVGRALRIGDGNAYGLVEQSGGTLNMNNCPAYVGNHHGTGVYRMTGGTFAGGNGTVYVGANDGTGTLEFGSGPTVASASFVAKNVNLQGTGATLKFVLDADGKAVRPNVTGTLTVGAGTKLVVDSTAYSGKSVKLMTFGTLSGSFVEEDVTFVGAPRGKVMVNAQDLRFLPKPHGLTLVFR